MMEYADEMDTLTVLDDATGERISVGAQRSAVRGLYTAAADLVLSERDPITVVQSRETLEGLWSQVRISTRTVLSISHCPRLD